MRWTYRYDSDCGAIVIAVYFRLAVRLRSIGGAIAIVVALWWDCDGDAIVIAVEL